MCGMRVAAIHHTRQWDEKPVGFLFDRAECGGKAFPGEQGEERRGGRQ